MQVVRIVVLAVAAVAWARAARAEMLFIPFIGGAFQGQTTLPLFPDLPPVPFAAPVNLSKSLVIGGSAMWLTSGVLGAEAELTHSPGFFERAAALAVPGTVSNSSATTLSGNVIVAVPRSITRDSLRPYLVGGLGLLRVGIDAPVNINRIDRNLLALNIGGGAIGYLGEHSGVRFDLRRIRSIRDEQTPGVRLSYWRASVGVTFRY